MKKISKIEISPLKFIDIGARWGIQRPWNRFNFLKLDYLGFEPDVVECEKLNSKSENNPYINFLPYALSDGEHNELLHLTKESGRSSIYEPNSKFLNKFHDSSGFEVIKKIPIKTTTIQSVFDEKVIDPDFMKIDTQGAELKILKGCNNYLNKLIGLEIEVEFHQIYINQPVFSDVDSFLTKNGFELFDLNRYWAKQKVLGSDYSTRGQVIFADAIYFRSIESFYNSDFQNDVEKINKFYKLIYSLRLYGFFDKAIEFINHLKSPISNSEKIRLINDIMKSSSYSFFQKFFLNNRIAFKLGVFLKIIANKFMIYPNSFGWGTDYNSFEGRYVYFFSKRLSKFFGRK